MIGRILGRLCPMVCVVLPLSCLASGTTHDHDGKSVVGGNSFYSLWPTSTDFPEGCDIIVRPQPRPIVIIEFGAVGANQVVINLDTIEATSPLYIGDVAGSGSGEMKANLEHRLTLTGFSGTSTTIAASARKLPPFVPKPIIWEDTLTAVSISGSTSLPVMEEYSKGSDYLILKVTYQSKSVKFKIRR